VLVAKRSNRVSEIIVRHMGPDVDRPEDAEGHLLHEAAALDIVGRNANAWPAEFRAAVLRRHPRLTLVREFSAAFHGQAGRKPGCAVAVAVSSRARWPDRREPVRPTRSLRRGDDDGRADGPAAGGECRSRLGESDDVGDDRRERPSRTRCARS
jgi:hypothetical protein